MLFLGPRGTAPSGTAQARTAQPHAAQPDRDKVADRTGRGAVRVRQCVRILQALRLVVTTAWRCDRVRP